jgi:hypothetical protein
VWGLDKESDEQFSDESSHLFSLYLAYADKQDKERVESWIAGADGILVFVSIFPSLVSCASCVNHVLDWPLRDSAGRVRD